MSVGHDVPYGLLGDPERLRGILVNLVANAIKFTNEGYVSIAVRAKSVTPEQAKLEFAVEDSGIGIPANKLSTIFESFSRVLRQSG